ncbi:MAG TPA: hypothetical protein VM528_04085 [Burkholderiaceae bacterium]|jgi:hypothetical protein|nr:hypothetical protein [Tahibacter sp.]HVJ59721.1 hypothetical protein [Burkholderiaceae bacterium]
MDRVVEAMVTGWQALRLVASALGPRRGRRNEDSAVAVPGEVEWLHRSEAFAEDLL